MNWMRAKEASYYAVWGEGGKKKFQRRKRPVWVRRFCGVIIANTGKRACKAKRAHYLLIGVDWRSLLIAFLNSSFRLASFSAVHWRHLNPSLCLILRDISFQFAGYSPLFSPGIPAKAFSLIK